MNMFSLVPDEVGAYRGVMETNLRRAGVSRSDNKDRRMRQMQASRVTLLTCR